MRRGIHPQRNLQILRRHSHKVLRDVLLRIGILVTAQLRVNRRDLIRAEAGAPAERHMLLRVRRSRKTRGRFVAPGDVILFDRHDRRQRIAHDYDAKPVVERGANDICIRPAFIGLGGSRHQDHGKQQQYAAQRKVPQSV